MGDPGQQHLGISHRRFMPSVLTTQCLRFAPPRLLLLLPLFFLLLLVFLFLELALIYTGRPETCYLANNNLSSCSSYLCLLPSGEITHNLPPGSPDCSSVQSIPLNGWCVPYVCMGTSLHTHGKAKKNIMDVSIRLLGRKLPESACLCSPTPEL